MDGQGQRLITSFFGKPRATSVKQEVKEENIEKKSTDDTSSPEKNSPLPDKPVQSAKKKVKKLESDDEEPVSRKKRRKCAVSSSSEDSEPDSAIEKPAVLKKADIFLKSVKSPTKSSKLPSSNETPLNGKLEIKKSNVSLTTKDAHDSKDGVTELLNPDSYNPGKQNYHPIQDATWKKGENVPYMVLAKTLELIEETSSRLKMIEILANYFRSVFLLSPDDLLCSVYLCLNQLAPAYMGIELGVGEGIIIKAIAQATGRATDKVKSDVATKGDVGLVAEASKGTQRTLSMFKPVSLTVKSVFTKLTEVAVMTGNSSQIKKVDKIHGILVAAKQLESRFITRSLAGKLRIGLAEQSVLQALAFAATATPPNQSTPPTQLNCFAGLSSETIKAKVEASAVILKTAYCQCPSYDQIIPVLLREGVEALPLHCTLTPGVPLKPMLACPTRGVGEVLQKFESTKFTCEWKYDGERAQIHLLENGEIRIYSRNQENNTSKYPDIISRFQSWIEPSASVRSAILDTEAVAWDTEKKQILPFQILSTRKRKDAVEADIKVQVCVYAFDLLYLNGESLVTMPLIERRQRLWNSFHKVDGQFGFATSRDPQTVEEIEEFLDESLKGNCEGLMVKGLVKDATYEIAKRSKNWLKLKKDYLDGIGDTIDAVVIGGYLGRGKRTGLYGGFLLACYDESNEEYQSLCKIGTGFSDEDFQAHSDFLKNHKIPKPKPYFRFDPSLSPDDWFEPVQVWEIKCADLSISPVHRAATGIVDPVKGISLRFPRFIRIRPDKNPENATSSEQIADLYNSQEQVKNKKTDDDEEGFY
ncbi:DNA ligase 1-like isoform X2 [Daphnia pulex]|uniref:DNA ligase 1-like isoform X2 n=1 Tax=Daphnia pulex TaxID=6669 RepID=UPI001EDF53C4|nr:DNA ligase 1-like isoform X2 [Daphnia pulex]